MRFLAILCLLLFTRFILAETNVAGTLPATATTTFTADKSPYRVTATLTVPVDSVLVIEPGVMLHFDAGAGLVVNGELRAVGSAEKRIHLTRSPDSTSTWNGVRFNKTNRDNRMAFVDMEFSDGGGAHIHADDSALRLSHMIWKNISPRRAILDLRGDTSFEVAHCTFPDVDAREPFHYDGHVPMGGFAVIRNCTFGKTRGYNDVIDMSTAKAPGPILYIIDNIFSGGGDDQLDLDGTDAWIEGNIFYGAHSVEGDNNPGLSSAIAGGVYDGKIPTWYIVRNYFYDLDHVALIKEGAYAHFINNTAVNIKRGGIAFFEPDRRDAMRSKSPGKGAALDGNIFWNMPETFRYVNHEGAKTELVVRNSILPGPAVHSGPGNSNADPGLRNISSIINAKTDLAPAAGAVILGASIPPGPTIGGLPSSPTTSRSLTLTLTGPQFAAYKYRLNDDPWSAKFSLSNPIRLGNLAPGEHTLSILTQNIAGIWQNEFDATIKRIKIGE